VVWHDEAGLLQRLGAVGVERNRQAAREHLFSAAVLDHEFEHGNVT
jgi:hypothetical protein